MSQNNPPPKPTPTPSPTPTPTPTESPSPTPRLRPTSNDGEAGMETEPNTDMTQPEE